MVKSNTTLIHLSVWIAYVIIVVFVYGYGKNDWVAYTYETTVSHIISAGVGYITALYIFPKFWDNKRYLLPVLLLMILGGSILLRFLFAFVISPYLLNTPLSVSNTDRIGLTLKFFLQWLTFSLFAVGYWQANTKIKVQRELSESIKEAAKRERLELENAALRAQINPHFIFNSLEHFRSQTGDSDPEVSYGIGCFMEILRAGIITPGADGKIPLEIETAAIGSTIYIFQQRFPDILVDHVINITASEDVRIVPHILLPFVENAFKHGDYEDETHRIQIELHIDECELKLHVSNKKWKRIRDGSNGIGIKYVKRSLDSGYKDKHNLIVNESDEIFTVNLTVQLN